ncbi:MAG: hypothetical protein EZS28_023160 [Streblomastix strix]|uniref:Uncharacterized protein n=1 Tax=Streblomastix strix TaxID=222440 RepID=A0A5J4VFT2_9EUKA|nr:MAG: hypothetical protein EZS28_023160 [Streblomastix strix]
MKERLERVTVEFMDSLNQKLREELLVQQDVQGIVSKGVDITMKSLKKAIDTPLQKAICFKSTLQDPCTVKQKNLNLTYGQGPKYSFFDTVLICNMVVRFPRFMTYAEKKIARIAAQGDDQDKGSFFPQI